MQISQTNQLRIAPPAEKKDSFQNLDLSSSPSPQPGGTILTLKRGKTIIRQDTSFLMPIDPKKLKPKQIVEFSRSGTQVPRSILSKKKQSEGILKNLNDSIITESVGNTSHIHSALRRSTVRLDQSLQNYHRTISKASATSGKSPASAGVKGILKKAVTVFARKDTTSPSPSPQTFRSRRDSRRDKTQSSIGDSSHSSYITRYRRKYINQQKKKQSRELDVAKSKDIFKVLKQGAFIDKSIADKNNDLAVLHLMDLDRIAKQSTLRSNSRTRNKRKSQKHEKKSRRKHMNLRNFQKGSSINLDENQRHDHDQGSYPNQYLLSKQGSSIMEAIVKRKSLKKVQAEQISLFPNTLAHPIPLYARSNNELAINLHRVNSVASMTSNGGGVNKSSFNVSNIAVQSPLMRDFKRRKSLFPVGPQIMKIDIDSEDESKTPKSKSQKNSPDQVIKQPTFQKKKTLAFRSRKFGEESAANNSRLQPRPTRSDQNLADKRKTAIFGRNQSNDSIQTEEEFKNEGIADLSNVQNRHSIQLKAQNSRINAARLRMKRQSTLATEKLRNGSLLVQLELIKQEILEEKSKLKEEIKMSKSMVRLKKNQKIKASTLLSSLRKTKKTPSSLGVSPNQINKAAIGVEQENFEIQNMVSQSTCCMCCQDSDCFWKLIGLNDNPFSDSDISSDDCEDNELAYKVMRPMQKQQHMLKLWKSCYIKLRAGVRVINIFSELQAKIYRVGVTRGISDIDLDHKIPWYIIMPTDQFKGTWNVFTILLLLYTAIVMPFKVSFTDQDNLANSIIEYIVDLLFFFDMIFTFFSAFEDLDGNMVIRLPKIAKNYVKSNFVFDVLAIYQKFIRLLRLPRLFRMLKVMTILKEVKFLQHHKYFNKLMKNLSMNTAIIRMIQGMFASLIVTHFFACFFFLTSKFDDFQPDTWVNRVQGIDLTAFQQYLFSIYWATQTIVTLGYGDIPAVTASEMILSLFWMIFGVGFYSFIIGNFSSIISGNIQIEATVMLQIRMLADLTKRANIPLELSRKIKKFIENNFESMYNQDDEGMLIKMLPPSLRDEVLSNTYGEIIEKVQFFRDLKDPDFLWKILPLLKPMKVDKGDILYWRGDHADDLYFILKGQIKLYTEKGFPYMKYQEGDFFGDSDTLLNLPRDGKAIAITHLKLMVLKMDQMFEKTFENQEKNYMEMIFNARKKRNFHLRQIQKANQQSKMMKQMKTMMKDRRNSHLLGKINESSGMIFSQDKSVTIDNNPTTLPTQISTSLFNTFKKTIVTSLFKGDDVRPKYNRNAFERVMQKKVQKQDELEGLQDSDRESPRFSQQHPSRMGTKKSAVPSSKPASDADMLKTLGINFNYSNKNSRRQSMLQKMSSSLVNKDITMNPIGAAIQTSMESKIEGLRGRLGLPSLFGVPQVQAQQSEMNSGIQNNSTLSRNMTLQQMNSASNVIGLYKDNTTSNLLQRQLSIIEEVDKSKRKPQTKQSSNSQAFRSQSTKKRQPMLNSIEKKNSNRFSSQETNRNSGQYNKQNTLQSQRSGFFFNRKNSKHSMIKSQMSSLIDVGSLIKNQQQKKSGRLSILDKVLQSAFKDQDLASIYEQYPILKMIEDDSSPMLKSLLNERMRKPNSAQNGTKQEVTQKPTIKLFSANMDEMTPRQRANYLVSKIKSKFDTNGKLMKTPFNPISGRKPHSSSNQLDTLPEIPHQSEQSSTNIVQSDSSSLRSFEPKADKRPKNIPTSSVNVLSIDRALGQGNNDLSPKSTTRPKIQSLFAKNQVKSPAIVSHDQKSQEKKQNLTSSSSSQSDSSDSSQQDSLKISINQINQDIERLNQKIDSACERLESHSSFKSETQNSVSDAEETGKTANILNKKIQKESLMREQNDKRRSPSARDNNFRENNMPMIIIQDKPSRLDTYMNNNEEAPKIEVKQQKPSQNNIDFNNLAPIKQENSRASKNSPSNSKVMLGKKHSVQIQAQNVTEGNMGNGGNNQKYRTSSVRVVAHRPSFLILNQQRQQFQKLFENQITPISNGYRQSRFISPISIQRIQSISNQVKLFANQNDDKSSQQQSQQMMQTPNSQINRIKDQQFLEKASSTNTGGKKSISEAVSIAVQNQIRNKMSQRIDQDRTTVNHRQISNQTSMLSHIQTQGRNQRLLTISNKRQGGFTEAMGNMRNHNIQPFDQEEEKIPLTEQDKKSQQDKTGQEMQDLDDYLLGDQSEFQKSYYNAVSQKSQDHSEIQQLEGLINMKNVILDEIKRKYSRNLDDEILKYQNSNLLSKLNTQLSSVINQTGFVQGTQPQSRTFGTKQQANTGQNKQISNYISVFDQSLITNNQSQNNVHQTQAQPSQNNSFIINTNFMKNLGIKNHLTTNAKNQDGISGPLSLDVTQKGDDLEGFQTGFLNLDSIPLTNNSSSSMLQTLPLDHFSYQAVFNMEGLRKRQNAEIERGHNQIRGINSQTSSSSKLGQLLQTEDEVKTRLLTNNSSAAQLEQIQAQVDQYFSLTNNSSAVQLGLTVEQMESLFQKQQVGFDHEQHIEFYGDPQMVGLVQLNADMCHIAMNVFETYTLFDLLNKSSQSQQETLQNINSQQSIIQQRQEKLDTTLYQIEQQLLIIKAIGSFKQRLRPKVLGDSSQVRNFSLTDLLKQSKEPVNEQRTHQFDNQSCAIYDQEANPGKENLYSARGMGRGEIGDGANERIIEEEEEVHMDTLDKDSRQFTAFKTLDTEQDVRQGLLVQMKAKGKLAVRRVMNRASQLFHYQQRLVNPQEMNY